MDTRLHLAVESSILIDQQFVPLEVVQQGRLAVAGASGHQDGLLGPPDAIYLPALMPDPVEDLNHEAVIVGRPFIVGLTF